MAAHAAAGNRAEALRVYERCRRLLAEELGAYPSPETESVYRQLLEAPSADSAAPAVPETAPPDEREPDRAFDSPECRTSEKAAGVSRIPRGPRARTPHRADTQRPVCRVDGSTHAAMARVPERTESVARWPREVDLLTFPGLDLLVRNPIRCNPITRTSYRSSGHHRAARDAR